MLLIGLMSDYGLYPMEFNIFGLIGFLLVLVAWVIALTAFIKNRNSILYKSNKLEMYHRSISFALYLFSLLIMIGASAVLTYGATQWKQQTLDNTIYIYFISSGSFAIIASIFTLLMLYLQYRSAPSLALAIFNPRL